MTHSLPSPTLLPADQLGRLFGVLHDAGYRVIGPTVRDQVLQYAELGGADDLPRGITDRQAPGGYRLEPGSDGSLFGYAVGPHSWKRYLHPPALRLFRAERSERGFTIEPGDDDPPRLALLGVRPCEVAAIARQDRVFLHGPYVDPAYRRRRERVLVVAVECLNPADTCFCTSMDTGPGTAAGFDLRLTELLDQQRHDLLVVAGSAAGAAIVQALAAPPATVDDASEAARRVAQAASRMRRSMPPDARSIVARRLEDPRWEAIAERCLACGNCTMVCPTCFCTTVEDTTDLTGRVAERWRHWDSCFTADFSYIHGGSVRRSTSARYRQWLTHKLSSWHDQFGESGCVGCGRCITWCPVGIDLTEEVAVLRSADAPSAP